MESARGKGKQQELEEDRRSWEAHGYPEYLNMLQTLAGWASCRRVFE
jgi:hypothetical protein